MNGIELSDHIIAFCAEHANADLVQKYERYFKEGFDAYGVHQDAVNAEVTRILNEDKPSLAVIFDAALTTVRFGKYEPIVIAILLVEKQKKHFSKESFDNIGTWFDVGIDNWAHCDVICSKLLPVMLLMNIVDLHDLALWLTSERKFKRRAVAVSFIPLIKKQPELIQSILDLTEPLMIDTERVVHQGMGWMLREAWKKSPYEVEAYLYQWKDRAARLIFQYATEKMSKEERLKFRKEKGSDR